MKNKFIIYLSIIIFFLLNFNHVFSNDFIFDTSEIKILDNGNIIKTTNGTATSTKDNISIVAKKFEYNKKLSILNAEDGVTTVTKENLQINANKFIYNANTSVLNAVGDVVIQDLVKKTLIKSQNIFYYIDKKIIKSQTKSSIEDNEKNYFLVESFTYTLSDNIVKLNNAKFADFEKNILQIEKAYLNLISKKLIGKDISIDFNNKSFKKENEPRLKGKTISISKNETLVAKGVFTTCKRNNDCPPWQFSAKEIKHDKKKKTIYYKSAWLKLYNKPVFYFPRFFHPDPTVKRQSGFLMPTFQDSNSLGASLNVPYYMVISESKDFTLKPRFYKNEKVLIQSEFRSITPKNNNILDFSFVTEKNNKAPSKSHFFSKTTQKLDFNNFDESNLSLQLQQTSNSTYLKTYKLKSPMIDEINSLTSSLGISAYREDLSFNTNFEVYENLSEEKNNDKYEFIYPSYDLVKRYKNSTKLSGEFSVASSGFFKNYNTNVYEKIMINDFIFNSNPNFTENGFKNNYNLLLKNVNSNSTNSTKFKNSRDHDLLSIVEYNSTYPLKKEGVNYNDILKPKLSLKYSPNNTKNMRTEDRRIDINNIFSMNRLSSNDTVEGGASLTYGIEFLKTGKTSEKDLFGVKIANILRLEEDKNLPRNSSLGNKTSDIVGGLDFNPTDILKVNYNFSIDNNLDNKNYELLSSEIKVNNFITTFEYLNENNATTNKSYLSNKTAYLVNDSNKFQFEIRENKKTKFTEFYNLIYQYTNDCLTAAIEYNKNYYSDKDLKPDENIFLKLTIIPFGETTSPNLRQK
jgi:LPS-assembly protein